MTFAIHFSYKQPIPSGGSAFGCFATFSPEPQARLRSWSIRAFGLPSLFLRGMLGAHYFLHEIGPMLHREFSFRAGAGPALPFSEVVFDTRQIHDAVHAVFLALPGGTRDGHQFILEAYRLGIRKFWVRDGSAVPSDCSVLEVADPLSAFQAFASAHRSRFSIPIVAITGSNGKTIVKEWLATLLGKDFQLVKSPKSFNSQIGVPLSLLGLHPEAELGLFEAGISQKGEMVRLEAMIQPTFGVLTHMGDAHAEGFDSEGEKLEEKLHLFAACQRVFVGGDEMRSVWALKEKGIPYRSVGFSPESDLQVVDPENLGNGWKFRLKKKGKEDPGEVMDCQMYVPGEAALENACLAALAALELGLPWESLPERLALLHPVSMRMELISDNPELSILNDSYNADFSSILNAFSLLAADSSHPEKAVILTDLEHQGRRQEEMQRQVLSRALQLFGAGNVILVGPVFRRLAQEEPGVKAYATTEDLLLDFSYEAFRGKVVLLKGARAFELERVIPYLSRRVAATWFRINLNALAQNFRFFRSRLKPGVRLMAMVKAFSYGSGSWEIAQALVQEGVDYLAVAYTSEGIALRTRGIQTPILVMNPDPSGIEQLFRFGLEPEVFHLGFLQAYVYTGRRLGLSKLPIHLKVDTGMRRLGFTERDLPGLRDYLQQNPDVSVLSVFSHMAAAEDPSLAGMTHGQAASFLEAVEALGFQNGKRPMLHILNSAGILNYPEYSFDMVRLGIGLYGVSPLDLPEAGLVEIGTLVTTVSQIHEYPTGTGVGYGFSQVTTRPSRIATVPIGYADGIRRSLGNGNMSFLIRGKRVPVMGRVCMDMLMLDVTDVPEAREGDEVVLVGKQGAETISVGELAEKCGTIPYEILTGISQRVRRVYVRE